VTNPPEEIVYLETAPNEPIARLWETMLRDAGIPALVQAEGPGMGAWGSVATFPHDLFVRAEDLERAWAIIFGDDSEGIAGE
jgi:hypothetical protein